MALEEGLTVPLALGLIQKDFEVVSARPGGVETTPLFRIQALATRDLWGLTWEYNGERISGPGIMRAGQTHEFTIYGDIAYLRCLFVAGAKANRHCSWIVALKEYDKDGRQIASLWKQEAVGLHNVTVNPRCDHGSSYKIRGIVSWKP